MSQPAGAPGGGSNKEKPGEKNETCKLYLSKLFENGMFQPRLILLQRLSLRITLLYLFLLLHQRINVLKKELGLLYFIGMDGYQLKMLA